MRGLKFFTRSNERSRWLLASAHSPHSLTWSWFIDFTIAGKPRDGRPRGWRPMFRSHRINNGLLQWWLYVPFIGTLGWHQQQPMWFRDMFWRKCEEVERLEHEARHPDPVPPPTAPFTPTVINGGRSLH